jgi:hypothetical protein
MNIIPPSFYAPPNPVGQLGEGNPKNQSRTMSVVHNHFNVNGTFMSEEQMMNRALQYAAWKDKAKRR